jgi:protein-tyrosine phosphatase
VTDPPIRVCFVCTANICRSPTAEGIMSHLVRRAGLSDRVEVESAGTAVAREGGSRDPRSAATAERRGAPLRGSTRRFLPEDFARFEYIVAVDARNRSELLALADQPEAKARVALLRDFDSSAPSGSSVPDPYSGGERGFDEVFDSCEAACRGLLETLVERLSDPVGESS